MHFDMLDSLIFTVSNYFMVSFQMLVNNNDWIDLAEDRNQWRALSNTVMNFRVPHNALKLLSSCTTGGFPRKAQLHK
jgi:hypothetical protein